MGISAVLRRVKSDGASGIMHIGGDPVGGIDRMGVPAVCTSLSYQSGHAPVHQPECLSLSDFIDAPCPWVRQVAPNLPISFYPPEHGSTLMYLDILCLPSPANE